MFMTTKRLITIFFLILTFGGIPFAYAQPSISQVSGTLSDASSITITGSNFGGGPTVLLFDAFEGGSTGAKVNLNGPRQGSWSGTSGATYDSNAHSGSHGFRTFDGVDELQLFKSFADCTEFFMSYWVRIPDGTYFPGAGSSKTFSTTSSWKMAWVMDGTNGYMGDDDRCLPSWSSSGGFTMGGNDYNVSQKMYIDGNPPSWWSWTDWMRHTVYLKGGSSPTSSNGILLFQGLSAAKGITTVSKTNIPIFDGDDNDNDNGTSRWNYLTMPGWMRGNSGTRPVYDDIYIATGANARARVEIGDNSSYSKCKNLTICTPTSWSSGQIRATINAGSFSSLSGKYLFVINADGNASSGYALSSDGGSTPSLPAPTNLRVID